MEETLKCHIVGDIVTARNFSGALNGLVPVTTVPSVQEVEMLANRLACHIQYMGDNTKQLGAAECTQLIGEATNALGALTSAMLNYYKMKMHDNLHQMGIH